MDFLLEMRSDDNEKTKLVFKEVIDVFGDFSVSIMDMNGNSMKTYRIFAPLLIRESSYFQKMLSIDMSEANSRRKYDRPGPY